MNLKIIHKNFTEIIELNSGIAPETCREIDYLAPFESSAEKSVRVILGGSSGNLPMEAGNLF